MSLYSGIKFASGPADTASPENSSSSSVAPAGNGTVVPTNASISEPKPLAKATGEWSAALKFAPRLNKPKLTSVPRPAGVASSAASSANSSTHSTAVVIEKQPDIVRSAEPKLTIPVGDDVMLGPDGKPLARAPAMTLAAAEKGRGRGTGAGWKREREGKGEGKRKKKKKKKQQHIVPLFDPEEQYDPNKPNDLGEYQAYRKRVREERKARLLEEKRRKAAGEESEGSSYYTDSEEEAPRRDAPRMFAPPKTYSPPSSSAPLPPAEPASQPPPLPPSTAGNDAYARRAAMSETASGDIAYALRPAMSQAASGDDAYARRVAMSQAAAGDRARQPTVSNQSPPAFAPAALPASEPPQTGFIPPPSRALPGAPPPPPANIAPPPPPPPSNIPGFGSFGIPAAVPSAPPVQCPSPAPALAAAPSATEDFQKMLQEKMLAASAIAAKYAHLSPVAPAPAPNAAPSPPSAPAASLSDEAGGSFAEKMMRRWGHKEGTGLGAKGTGIVHALAAEHVDRPPKSADPNQPLSKRQLAKQKAAAANLKNRKWVQHAHARGKIVNSNDDERAAEEKARSGEASRVVCLRGMVGGLEEVDEDLADEIGEECSKFGIVERVVLHMVEPPPPEPSECLRVFIVFSGMAGAWRAIKELDGRFFSGNKIRATYFDEARFDAADRDGEV